MNGQKAMKDTATHFAQCVEEIAEQLPLKLTQSKTIIVAQELQNVKNTRQFNIRPHYVNQTLKWLKANNILYQNVKITPLSEKDIDLDQIIVKQTANHITIPKQISSNIHRNTFKTNTNLA
jgi:hypothetical protein